MVAVPSPTCPSAFAPQQERLPSRLVAHELVAETDTRDHENPPTTWVGLVTDWGRPLYPLPTCPSSLLPQHQMADVLDDAQVWEAPATMFDHTVDPYTWVGKT